MTPSNRFDAIAAFEREMIAFGLVLPRGGVVPDGQIHRLDDGQHRRKRNGAGWYSLRELPSGLLVGRAGSWWRDRGAFKWNSRGDTRLTPADRKAIAELNRQLEVEKAKHYREGAERAAQIWAAGKSCRSHPYLARKSVKAHNLRVDHDGRLLIPLRDLDGELRGVQRIDAKGNKRFTYGTDRERPTCLLIGKLDGAANVAVVEGYATGATVHEATGWPVVVAFDAGGVEKIAKPLRDRLLSATLIFAGDHDLEEKGGRGQKAAKRAARDAGGVAALPPTEGHDWNDHSAEHGLEDVENRLLKAAGIVALPSTVTLAAGTAQLEQIIGGFFGQAQAWHDLPEEQRTKPTAHLVNATMGAGKSRIARAHAGCFLERNKAAAVSFALPLHRLTAEQAAAFKAETGGDAAIWRGMEQPDPERDDGKAMCLQPELSKAAQDASANVSEICKVCPSRNDCGYRRQQQQQGRAWYFPHQLLFHPKPKAIPAPALLVIDEKFHNAGMAENIRLAASTLEGDVSDVPHAGDRDLLRELRGMLLAALKAAGDPVGAAEKRTRLTKGRLEAAGLTADLASQAKAVEWKRKPKPKLSGDVVDMVRTLQAMAGRFTTKVPTLWGLIEDLLRSDHDTATTIELEPNAKLQGGDGHGLLIWMHHRLDVHESWRSPTLVLDGTARPEIIRHWFPELHVAPAVHIEAPHQRVTWVRASFAKARLVATTSRPALPSTFRVASNPTSTPRRTEDADDRRNRSRQNNLEELRRYIEVQAATYRGRGTGSVDVLVIANLAVEERLRAGRLPANVAVEHFNNLRGTNTYERVRAVIVIGRTLPDEKAIHRQAERMAGHPLDQADPLVMAERWSICEAELLQVIARARGIRRTDADPLDVLLLGDVPLPLKIDQVVGWEQAQPAPLELLAARGVVPACEADAKGYWATVAALLPDVFKDVQAAKDAARGSRWNPSIRTILIDKSHRESWQAVKARPHGGRYSIPVLVDPERRHDLAAIVELAAISDGTATGHSDGPALEGNSVLADPVVLPASPPAAVVVPVVERLASPIANPLPLPAEFSTQYAREADALADYAGGIMPDAVRDQVRGRWRASGLRQDQLAQRAGISRPQFANALQGRFGLSADAATRLRAVVASLPLLQVGSL